MSNQPTSNPSPQSGGNQQGGGSVGTKKDDPQHSKSPSDKEGQNAGSQPNDQNRKNESGRGNPGTGGGSSTQR
jgi:hypothetical protein